MTTALSDQSVIQFSRGIPPLEAIAVDELAVHTAAVIEETPGAAFQYAPIGRNRGDLALREQLGLLHRADPEGIFVGGGSLQVLDLIAGCLLQEGGDVYVEAPTYDRAIGIFERHGAKLIGIPLEHDGLDVERLAQELRERPATLVYTIPDFQNPAGVTMGEEKRRALVGLAGEHGFPILEDIPYRELRYTGARLPSLAEVAAAAGGGARVITLGSLSKVLSPGLRIGYAITDPDTAMALAALAEGTYLSPVPLCQAVAARCLAAGLMERSVDRACALFAPRHAAAVAAVRSALGDVLLAEPGGGYYVSVHLPTVRDEADLMAAARAAGVVVTRGSAFYPPRSSPPAGTAFVRLPFQALEPAEFAAGVERLAAM